MFGPVIDQHARAVVQGQVVGDERRGQHLFDHPGGGPGSMRMHGSLTKRGQLRSRFSARSARLLRYVQLGQGGGGVLQRRQVADQVFEQGVIEHLLAGQGAALGRQRLVLEGLRAPV